MFSERVKFRDEMAQSTLEVVRPFLERHQLTFFNYCRFYDDNTCFAFSNQPALIEHFFQKKFPLVTPISNEDLASQFWYLIPENGSYAQAVSDAKNLFQICSPIDWIQRHSDHFDMFCFGASPYRRSPVQFYLNQLHLLEAFCRSFSEKMEKSVQEADRNRILLSEEMKPQIDWKALDQTRLKSPEGFTTRENECIKYLLRGHTAKQIALNLNISTRTVEVYIDQIKQKLGCQKKSEIADAFIENYCK